MKLPQIDKSELTKLFYPCLLVFLLTKYQARVYLCKPTKELRGANKTTAKKYVSLFLYSLYKIIIIITIIYSRKHQSNCITMPAFIFIIYKIKTLHIIQWTCRYYVGTQINDDIKIFPFSFSDVIVYYPHLLHIYTR